jgi:hypothetical protein
MTSENAQLTHRSNADDPRTIEQLHIAACLHAVLDLGDAASPLAAKHLTDRLLADAVETEDPIEKMMIEQLAMAHHRIGSLHSQAASTRDIKKCEAYSSAAQRLLGEFRRLVLALRDYRTPVQGRSTTIVHRVEQFNHSEGSQDVAYTQLDGGHGGSRLECSDTEMTSNTGQEEGFGLHEQRERRLQESQAGRSRSTQPLEA